MMSDYYYHEQFKDYSLDEESDFETEEEAQAYFEAEMAKEDAKYTTYCKGCGERVDYWWEHEECDSRAIC